MPLPQQLIDKKLATGILVGVGLALVVPVAITTLAPIVRPFARSAFRSGAALYEKAREGVAEMSEMAQDVVAEVQEEMRQNHEAEIFAAAAETNARTESEQQSAPEGAPGPAENAG